MFFRDPLPAVFDLTGKEVCPDALRQIIFRHALVIKDWRDEQAVPEHILFVKIMTGFIFGKFHDHAAHTRDAGLVCRYGSCIQVRHDACFQSGEKPHDIDRFLVIDPGNPVG